MKGGKKIICEKVKKNNSNKNTQKNTRKTHTIACFKKNEINEDRF